MPRFLEEMYESCPQRAIRVGQVFFSVQFLHGGEKVRQNIVQLVHGNGSKVKVRVVPLSVQPAHQNANGSGGLSHRVVGYGGFRRHIRLDEGSPRTRW